MKIETNNPYIRNSKKDLKKVYRELNIVLNQAEITNLTKRGKLIKILEFVENTIEEMEGI